ncbi:MAG: serine/threonine-protein kinase [Persicimonas sp.]
MADGTQSMVAYCAECGAEYDSSFSACPEDGAKLYHYSVDEQGDDALVGEVLDARFRIERVLGEGGMGKVYRASQLSVDRPVALKVLHGSLSSDQSFIKRFLREARVVSNFKHPNIVSLVDFGQDAERNLLYLVMELLDGQDLDGLLDRGRFHPELALEIAAQVCAALSEPHANEVVHRDLKPDNLMLTVTSDGSLQVKVLDFGIAQAVDGDTKLTQTGMVFGTPQYMAPEQAAGAETSASTDIYALGIILYSMLVGRPPFEGETAMQIILHHMQSPVPDVREFAGLEGTPPSLAELVGDMVQKDPADRPATVLEVRDRLEAIMAEMGASRVRLDVSKPHAEMFAPWLLGPIVDGTAGVASDDVSTVKPTPGDSGQQDVSGQHAATTVRAAEQTKSRSKWPIVLILIVLLGLIGGSAGAVWNYAPYGFFPWEKPSTSKKSSSDKASASKKKSSKKKTSKKKAEPAKQKAASKKKKTSEK